MKFKKGINPWNKGKKYHFKKKRITTQKVRDALSKAKKGKPSNRKGKKLTEEQIKTLSLAHKGKMIGELHPNWKGGIRLQYERIRKSDEWKEWRESVFTRDDYTCQKCFQVGGTLHPHHIINSAQVIESRFDINNGITLCKVCHMEFHSLYGMRSNNKEQLINFLNEQK